MESGEPSPCFFKTITDGAGRVTTLDMTPEGYLIGIVDPSNRRTSFSYNGVQLDTITYPDGTTTKYTYDASNTLTSATYNNGYKIAYSYYPASPNRVSKVLETHANGTLGAKWFKEALGFTQENAGDLAKQIVFNPNKAVQTAVTEFGTKYNQVISVQGANGRVIDVTFAWIRNNDGVIRLITGIPTGK